MVRKKKEDKVLRDLFRDTLKNMEVTPSSAVRSHIMRRLRVREFFSFDPSRFNIWYTGLIAGTVTLACLVLSGGNKETADIVEPLPPVSSSNVVPVSHDTLEMTFIDSMEKEKIIVEEVVPEFRKTPVPEEIDDFDPTVNETISHDTVMPLQPKSHDLPETRTNTINEIIQPSIMDNDTEGIKKSKSGVSHFTASTYEGCSPLVVSFTVNGMEDYSFRWSFDDGGYSSEKDPEWLFDEAGDYNVTLKILYMDSVISSYTEVITVHQRPIARFEIFPENVTIPDEAVTFLNYSSGAMSYNWIFGDGERSELYEPIHIYDRYGDYDVTLLAFSENGCVDSVTIEDAFELSAYYIEMPNAFVPNVNGPSGGHYTTSVFEIDKVFHPVSYGVAEYQLRVFNRLGLLLFESEDLEIGWDGYYRNNLCDPGVYVWKVRGTYINGEPFTIIGDVTLIKSLE